MGATIPMDKSEKNALVTGAAVRIGRQIVLDLAADGWGVAIHFGTSAREANELVEAVIKLGGRACALQADLALEDDVQSLISSASEAIGPLTCLVNNAARFERDDIHSLTRESWDTHMDANLYAPMILAQKFAAALPEDAKGNIINIVDQRVMRPTPLFTSYTISKIGLWAATQTLAQALAPLIRVNAVGPGPTLPSPRQSEKHFAAQVAATPLGTQTRPEDVARAVIMILNTPSMTGQLIVLDGGQNIAWATPDVAGVEE